jgi:beta-glucosidase
MGLQAGRQYRLRVEYDCLRGEPPGHLRMHVGPACGRDWAAEIAAAAGLAAQCDAAVVCIGYAEGHETEGRDRPDMDLPPGQEALVRAVVAANPRTAVVLTCGAPVTMPWLDAAPAALLAWYPGMEGGAAVAEALLGDANPCGKLPVTFPRRIEDTPAFGHFGGGDHVLYGEGVFVGYRHYDARAIEPLMAFGHGLSYTSFGYSDLNLPAASDLTLPVEVSLTVTNTGPVAGSEIVQVYIGDLDSSLPRPPRELKGFAKVSLAPGESRRVAMALDRRAFAFYDPGRGDWVVESGRFEIFVGASSRDIRLRGRIEVQQGASRTWQVESYA